MLANSQPQSEVMHLKIITIMVYKKKLLPLCDNDNSMLFMNSESVCRE